MFSLQKMNLLADVSPGKAFYCADGSALKNLRDLEHKLRIMTKDAFAHHVNSQRNDFYSWIKDVFQDQKLAEQIRKALTAAEAAKTVKNRIEEEMQAQQEIEKALKATIGQAGQVSQRKTAAKNVTDKLKEKTVAAAKKEDVTDSKKKIHKSKGLQTVVHFIPKQLPDAKSFLASYFAMERPTVSHLYFTKGIVDFLLGIVIGIVLGLIIANMV